MTHDCKAHMARLIEECGPAIERLANVKLVPLADKPPPSVSVTVRCPVCVPRRS